MYISEIKIKGFRSLGDIEVNLEKYTSLIGKNDCGKSSFLHALNVLFDPDTVPSDDDICKIPGYQNGCFIEATLKDCYGHSELEMNGEIRLRRLIQGRASQWQFWGRTPVSETLQKMADGTLTRGDLNADSSLLKTAKDLIDSSLQELSPSGRVRGEVWKEIYKHLSQNSLIEWKEGWCSLEPGRLPSIVQIVMLEADARGEEEVVDGSKSTFNRIGGVLLRDATRKHSDITQAIEKLGQAIQTIATKNENEEWIIAELNQFETIFNEEVKRFDSAVTAKPSLLPPKIPNFEFGVKVDISDSWIEGLNKMGHGLRRSVIFAMLRAHRRLREARLGNGSPDKKSPSTLYLFLIEEPELYLHPQAERRRMRELKELSQLEDSQVILCTHSAIFVDMNEYKGIIRFNRPNREVTTIQKWAGMDLGHEEEKMLKMINLLDPNRSAMMFADLVILVEGLSEKMAIPFLAEEMSLDLQDKEIVDCGGASNIPHCQRILEGFGIKYVAWLDSDRPDDVRKTKANRKPENGKVIITPGNWEKMSKLPNGDKIATTWKHFIRDRNAPNEKLKNRVLAAFSWEDFEKDPE